MPNPFFQFKQFRINQSHSGMKVTTDACLFGGWVVKEIKKLKKEPARILDIGAGTGLLSLMLAQGTEKSTIDAVEINRDSFEEADQNFSTSMWKSRLTCYKSTIQDFGSAYKYDLIICNPPFFKDSLKGVNDNKNQALHAESLSMADLIISVERLLSDVGIFYLLYPKREMDQFVKNALLKGLFPKGMVNIRNREDGQVIRQIGEFSKAGDAVKTQELIIREANNRYTKGSWALLRDYYLEYNNPESGPI